jgi:hypothetical protein
MYMAIILVTLIAVVAMYVDLVVDTAGFNMGAGSPAPFQGAG